MHFSSINMRLDSRLLHETRSSRPALILTLSLGLAGGLFTVLQARGLSKAIDAIFLKRATLADIYPLLGFLLVVILLRAGAAWGGEVTAHAVAARVKWDLRLRLYRHIQELGPSYTTAERTGELSNTIIEGIEALEAYFSHYLPQLALAALVPVAVLVFVFPLDVISGGVLLLTAPLIPVFMVLIGSLAESLTKKQWLSLSRISAYFLDVLQGLTTLKILGRSREQIGLIARASDCYRDATMSVLRITFLSALVLELVSTLSTAVVAVEIGLRLLYGYLSFEQALFVLILAPEFYLPLRLLGTRFHAAMAGFEAAQRIYAILETPVPEVNRRSLEILPAQALRASDFSFPSVITFEGVCYRYPDERAALNGASFSIEPGQLTALVGPSGSGKSTVVALLLRFLEPQDGVIRVRETPLSEISPEAWRRQVAWVPQNPYLFNDTVAANLRMARPEASPQEIDEAARQAGADSFIRRLPQGYETLIGERGAFLSAGQVQQLAIARAFLKDAPLLILDEATSHLDPATEDHLQEAILRLVHTRTTLVIAHRLPTIRQARRIVVLSAGRVVESGSHAELIRQNGLYRRLAHAWEESQAGITSSHSSLEWSSDGEGSVA
jgi:thiol reductant ABC exporter CydD subunit